MNYEKTQEAIDEFTKAMNDLAVAFQKVAKSTRELQEKMKLYE
jgi:flagellin-specific chaperone FliS